MFSCDRCGSRYSTMHAAAIENCPRCRIRDRISAPLTITRLEAGEAPEAARLEATEPALELDDGAVPHSSPE